MRRLEFLLVSVLIFSLCVFPQMNASIFIQCLLLLGIGLWIKTLIWEGKNSSLAEDLPPPKISSRALFYGEEFGEKDLAIFKVSTPIDMKRARTRKIVTITAGAFGVICFFAIFKDKFSPSLPLIIAIFYSLFILFAYRVHVFMMMAIFSFISVVGIRLLVPDFSRLGMGLWFFSFLMFSLYYSQVSFAQVAGDKKEESLREISWAGNLKTCLFVFLGCFFIHWVAEENIPNYKSVVTKKTATSPLRPAPGPPKITPFVKQIANLEMKFKKIPIKTELADGTTKDIGRAADLSLDDPDLVDDNQKESNIQELEEKLKSLKEMSKDRNFKDRSDVELTEGLAETRDSALRRRNHGFQKSGEKISSSEKEDTVSGRREEIGKNAENLPTTLQKQQAQIEGLEKRLADLKTEKSPKNDSLDQIQQKWKKRADMFSEYFKIILLFLAFFILLGFFGKTSLGKDKSIKPVRLPKVLRKQLKIYFSELYRNNLSPKEEVLQSYYGIEEAFSEIQRSRESFLPSIDYVEKLDKDLPFIGRPFRPVEGLFSQVFYGNYEPSAHDIKGFRKSIYEILKKLQIL